LRSDSQPTRTTERRAVSSVFAKVDVTFGDNIDGVGGKAGMRVSW
jgi:hypothetical protein